MDNSDNVADPGSLRFALANVAAGTTIDFAPSVRDIVLTSNTTLMVNTNVNIVNDLGTGPVTIDGNNAVSVFTVNTGATALLSGLTITRGNGNGDGIHTGGGVQNDGTLTINNCSIVANTASNAGAGIDNNGTLTVTGSTFSANSTPFGGGGIYNAGFVATPPMLTVNNCTFSGNSANSGGGIFTDNGAVTVSDSTFSGNFASVDGGGIDINAATTLNGDIIV
jgi:predicted outer membrane repeat protein